MAIVWALSAMFVLGGLVGYFVRWMDEGQQAGARLIDIVFEKETAHPHGERFVEVESPPGKSISFGKWVKRNDGYWVLRFRAVVEP